MKIMKKLVAVASALAITTTMLTTTAFAASSSTFKPDHGRLNGKDRYETSLYAARITTGSHLNTYTNFYGTDNMEKYDVRRHLVKTTGKVTNALIIANGAAVVKNGKAQTGAASISDRTWSAATLAQAVKAPVVLIPNTTTSTYSKILNSRTKLSDSEEAIKKQLMYISAIIDNNKSKNKTFTIYLLGNKTEIPEKITTLLNKMCHNTTIDYKRIEGSNKISTNMNALKKAFSKIGGNKIANLVICQSNSYQNLVTASNYHAPIMLANSSGLTTEQINFLKNNIITKVTLVGPSFTSTTYNQILTNCKKNNSKVTIDSSTKSNYLTSIIAFDKAYTADQKTIKNTEPTALFAVNGNAPIDCITTAAAVAGTKHTFGVICTGKDSKTITENFINTYKNYKYGNKTNYNQLIKTRLETIRKTISFYNVGTNKLCL